MTTALITGGSGFFGELLIKKLLKEGFFCVNIDLEKDLQSNEHLESIQGDIRNKELLKSIFSRYNFDVIFHCAAILAHAVKDKDFLWSSNVTGTKNIAEFAKRYHISKVIFISSNCLWAKNFHRPVFENDIPHPVEIYGKSKYEGEKILLSYKDSFSAIIFRTPTIMDAGRLGLLSILFEFVDEGKKLWIVGSGENRYQFIYAKDLIQACLLSLNYNKTEIFNIGSDNVKSFNEVYSFLINKAGTKSKIAHFPRFIAIPLMKIAYFLKISPLGPYQYKMIAEDFVFNTNKIKRELKWKPTKTNKEMLYKSYEYYHENKNEILNRKNISAHKQVVNMGIIKLLKYIS